MEWKRRGEYQHETAGMYTAWRHPGDGTGAVYQMLPYGETPSGTGGYYSLESAIALKNVKPLPPLEDHTNAKGETYPLPR